MSPRSTFFEPLRQNPRLIPLLFMICLIMAGYGVVVPVLPLYAKTFQVATTLIGMVITIFGVGRIVANYPAGYLSQIVGRRPLLAAGASILVVSSIGAALARDFTTLVVWRFIEGFGSGIYMTCSMAALADASTPQTRGHAMSLYQTAQLVGSTIGPGIGGWFAYHYGYTAPFWAYAGIAGVVLVTSFVSFEDSRQPLPRKQSVEAAAGGGLMTIPFAASCLMGGVNFFTRTAAQFQLLPLIAYDDFHLDVDVIGLALMVTYLAMFTLLPLAGTIIDRFRRALLRSVVEPGSRRRPCDHFFRPQPVLVLDRHGGDRPRPGASSVRRRALMPSASSRARNSGPEWVCSAPSPISASWRGRWSSA